MAKSIDLSLDIVAKDGSEQLPKIFELKGKDVRDFVIFGPRIANAGALAITPVQFGFTTFNGVAGEVNCVVELEADGEVTDKPKSIGPGPFCIAGADLSDMTFSNNSGQEAVLDLVIWENA